MGIRTLIVDDEEAARDRLQQLLGRLADLAIVGTAEDGDEALDLIRELSPDVVFLEIEMPGKTGIQVAAHLPPPRPQIIYCTEYDQFAVEAFEQHALDYLLKPVSRVRLAKAVDRVQQSLKENAWENGETILVFTDGLTEAMDSAEEEFGEERLLELVQANPDRPVNDLAKLIEETVMDFVEPGSLHDDLTLIVARGV